MSGESPTSPDAPETQDNQTLPALDAATSAAISALIAEQLKDTIQSFRADARTAAADSVPNTSGPAPGGSGAPPDPLTDRGAAGPASDAAAPAGGLVGHSPPDGRSPDPAPPQGGGPGTATPAGDKEPHQEEEVESEEEDRPAFDDDGASGSQAFTSAWYEERRGQYIPAQFEIPRRFEDSFPVGFTAETVEHFRTFGGQSISPGRASEANQLYITAAYLCLISNDLAEIAEDLAAIWNRSPSGTYPEALRNATFRLSDAQLSAFGVYELSASKYEVLCGRQGAASVADPELLLAYIDPPAAFSAAGRQAFRRQQVQAIKYAAQAAGRWQADGTDAATRLLGSRTGASQAARLLGHNLASSTQAAYRRLWESFTTYCRIDSASSFPATPATVVCYLGYLYSKGTVRGGSLRPYIAAIGTQHRRLGFRDPTKDQLVSSARRGYLSNDGARSGGPPLRSAPPPAACAEAALRRALAVPQDTLSLQRWGIVALGFILCSRPTSLRLLRRRDVQLGRSEVTLQMVTFKYGESGSAPRIAIRIPLVAPVPADPIYRLLHHLLQAAPSPDSYLFPGPGPAPAPLSAADLRAVIAALVASRRAPAGTKFTARSLRSGGISTAYAVGVRLATIMRLSNHSSAAVVHRHYLDALLPASPAARLFFGRFTTPIAAQL